MKKKLFLAFQAVIIILLSTSCGGMREMVMKEITKPLPPLDDSAEVTVYDSGDIVPEHSEIIGGVAVSHNGTWEATLENAKKEARAAGGNGLEIQMHIYPAKHLPYQGLTAAILNINDSIVPSEPEPFDKVDFNDYIVTKDNDTVPCLIVFENQGLIGLVYGYNKLGYSKSMRVNKSDILSYHIDDPDGLSERQKKNTRNIIHKKVFTVQFAADLGLSSNGGKTSPLVAGKIRFQSNHKFNLGVNYDYFTRPGSHFIAASFGFSGVPLSGRESRTPLESILDCGCDTEREVLAKNRFFLDFFVGYHINHTFDETYHGLGIGCALGYDRMISEHFGLGFEINCYPVIERHYHSYGVDYANFNLKAGLRYYL